MPPVKKYYSLIFFMKKICSEKKKSKSKFYLKVKNPLLMFKYKTFYFFEIRSKTKVKLLSTLIIPFFNHQKI